MSEKTKYYMEVAALLVVLLAGTHSILSAGKRNGPLPPILPLTTVVAGIDHNPQAWVGRRVRVWALDVGGGGDFLQVGWGNSPGVQYALMAPLPNQHVPVLPSIVPNPRVLPVAFHSDAGGQRVDLLYRRLYTITLIRERPCYAIYDPSRTIPSCVVGDLGGVAGTDHVPPRLASTWHAPIDAD